jgi:GNAT superfamily N-acetyltransferase
MMQVILAQSNDMSPLQKWVAEEYMRSEAGLIKSDFPRMSTAEMLVLINAMKVFKAVKNEEILGCFKLEILGDEAQLGMMAVSHQHQGTGLGTLMLNSALEIAKIRFCSKIRVEVLVPKSGSPSIYQVRLCNWYQKKGFIPTERLAYEALAPQRALSQQIPCEFICLEKRLN